MATSARSDPAPYLIYRPEFDRQANRRASLAVALGQALTDAETGEASIRLDYQPVFRLRRPLSLIGVEALLRWDHELYGAISPEETVEVAQATGQQAALNRFVVTSACRQAAAWSREFPELPFLLSINASPQEVTSGDLVENLQATVETSGTPPGSILVEISQRIRNEDLGVVTANLEALVALGIGIVIDDFGRGASSLSFLHELPLTAIKLDRSLVVSSLTNEADAVLAESIVALARRLGVYAMAEGIESAEHLALTRDLGCGWGQGHYLGRPDDVASATAELAAEANRLSVAPGPDAAPDGGSR
ncbi:MAG: EAL domain-containing protein [Actinomycetota bacterium]